MQTAYKVALLSRGTGQYTFTYSAAPGLAAGQLCAVSFRHQLELGIVTGVDPAPPATAKLLALWPLKVADCPGWGLLLSEMAELSCSMPREVAGHLLFTTPAAGMRLHLNIAEPESVPPLLLPALGTLSGNLTPAKRKQLMQVAAWNELCALAAQGTLALQLALAGLPGQTRAHSAWRRLYETDELTLSLHGLDARSYPALPGSYLAGLLNPADYSAWKPAAETRAESRLPSGEQSALHWADLHWTAGWALPTRWPELSGISVRRAFADWAELRGPRGLAAELADALGGAQNVLLIAPQVWMLERLWPALAPWANRVHRFQAEAGPSAAAHILRALAAGGQVVAGGPAAWKLAAYARFQRVLLLDPTHPGYEPEGEPSLDPRLALLLALAGSGARLELIELGLSAWDGRSAVTELNVLAPHDAEDTPPALGAKSDTDPLPLILRQPGRRRLVYFNRLGSSRGLRCSECGHGVTCPRCSSARLHYSGDRGNYACPQCGFSAADLRCQNCGLSNIATHAPGLEAVLRRPGDVIIEGARKAPLPQVVESVLGTAQLLEPLTGFWPQEVVYVHAASRRGPLDDWPRALDEALRLRSLYANPELSALYVVSAKLAEQFAGTLSAAHLEQHWMQEHKLAKLAALPPFGRILYLRLRGATLRGVADGRRALAQRLAQAGTPEGLSLGKPYQAARGFALAGYVLNPALDHAAWQELRAELARGNVSLLIHSVWGPWL